jgi:hypothetical protein
MKWFKLFAVLAVLALALSLVPTAARAQGPDGNGRVIPNLGPVTPGLTSGVNGYKVFGPDAFRRVPIQPLSSSSIPTNSINNLYRAVWTDEYGCGYTACGSHNSQSDLLEEKIWVDGAAKWSWASGWQTSCGKHTAGHLAQCGTTLAQDFCAVWTAIGHSWHYFHTANYGDLDTQTEDTWHC